MKMLVIDDDTGIREALTVSFTTEWETCEVLAAEDGATGLRLFEEQHPALVILDIGLPGIDGIEVLARIRQRSDVPVVMLSACDSEAEVVRALELGADDYVTKPFRYLELMARIKAVQRRVGGPAAETQSDALEVAGLRICYRSQEVAIHGAPVMLTNTEYRLLYHLVRNRGRVLSHRELLRLAWGSESYGTDVVRVYVSRLRAKIEPEPAPVRYIQTKPGVGYLFAPQSAEVPSDASAAAMERRATRAAVSRDDRARRWRWGAAVDAPTIRLSSPVG